ncbi:type I-E CRISPR-associated endoribonuclease Cas2e [Corynebacterium vitaeruminis]|uniref:CRISPR-associated protein n=1 Tax=Corynebacterium vitaeruminis DSM 20294 TaxID=1224164 RepID=W5Y2E6_9CORY|nr:type I-E CRISPR-associated endoribonuclease Cas2e [Corynebacterium vitaeruminis]AHI23416.1 CRISPR-associated protein [Corynebacterium vitaeruminis DSM 20294]
MMVLVVTACPAGLRGDLTKWLMEISPGVFVGRPSARVRDAVWERTCDLVRDGRAILVHNAANEQGFDFKVHRNDWVPTDFDGIKLMIRPDKRQRTARRTGWSKARRMR